MRVNVDSKIASDPRIKRLAHAMDKPGWQDVIGHLIGVWLVCYEQRSELMDKVDVDIAAGKKDFAILMVEAGLAKKSGRKLKIRGVTERIEFLKTQQSKGFKGGRPKKPKVIKNKANGFDSENHMVSETKAYSLTLSPSPSPSPSLTPSPAQSLPSSAVADPAPVLPKAKKTKPKAFTNPEHESTRLAWFAAFAATHGGSIPAWGSAEAGLLASLLKRLPASEVRARIERMVKAPPSWPPGPYDLRDFARHIDKFAGPAPVADVRVGRVAAGSETDYGPAGEVVL